MPYIRRHAEAAVKQLANMFGAVLVTGPGQVGKATMLQNMLNDVRYVSMDDAILQTAAVENSNAFIKDDPPPVFIDEVQKAPELLPQIKLSLDESKQKGQFYLSGSQQYKMIKNVSESLSGRIGVLTLLVLSDCERLGADFTWPFPPTEEYFAARSKSLESLDYQNA